MLNLVDELEAKNNVNIQILRCDGAGENIRTRALVLRKN